MDPLVLWIHAHPVLTFFLALGVVSNLTVAVTPKRLQNTPWFGAVLFIAHRLSILNHGDQYGTIQIPLIAKAIVFGRMLSPLRVTPPAVPTAVTPLPPSERDTEPPKNVS